MQNGDGRMKILILSCNTGEGHNSAGWAVKEYLELQGHQVVMEDMMLLKGARTSKAVGGAYVGIVKHFPLLFGLGYRLGGWVSSDKRKSPVYYACSLLAGTLKGYLEQKRFDAVVTPHLYPAETLTAMKKKGWLKIPVVAIGTDYTCIPFWEETDCEYYVIPHEDLIEEFVKRGIPREKLLPWGIPVRQSFMKQWNKKEARKICHIPQNNKSYLVMGGSMGFGKIQIFVLELARRMEADENMVVICGNNKKLEKLLKRELVHRKNVKVLGYTDQVAAYMAACDVIFTKPGGLSSTEAAMMRIPMVHTNPIPGCETKNVEFFQKHGMSIGKRSFVGQVRTGEKLLERGIDVTARDKKEDTPKYRFLRLIFCDIFGIGRFIIAGTLHAGLLHGVRSMTARIVIDLSVYCVLIGRQITNIRDQFLIAVTLVFPSLGF